MSKMLWSLQVTSGFFPQAVMIPEGMTLANIVLDPLTVPSDDSFVSVYIKKNASTDHLIAVLKKD